jgi:hypothetical protein
LLAIAHRPHWRPYLALSQLLALDVEFAMSKLHPSKPAVDEIALLLAAEVEPQKIAHSFHCHAATVYKIK